MPRKYMKKVNKKNNWNSKHIKNKKYSKQEEKKLYDSDFDSDYNSYNNSHNNTGINDFEKFINEHMEKIGKERILKGQTGKFKLRFPGFIDEATNTLHFFQPYEI